MARSTTYWKLWETLPAHTTHHPWQPLSSLGNPLSSSSHFNWQKFPGITWDDNTDSSRKFLVKKHMVFLVSIQDYSPPHKACGYIKSAQSSVPGGQFWNIKGKHFFFFLILPFKKILQVSQSAIGETMSVMIQHTATFQSVPSVQFQWRVTSQALQESSLQIICGLHNWHHLNSGIRRSSHWFSPCILFP